MRYRTIGTDAATQRSVSVLSLGAMLMGSRTDGTQGGESEKLLGRADPPSWLSPDGEPGRPVRTC